MHTWKPRPLKVTLAEPLKRRSQLGWNRWWERQLLKYICSDTNACIALDSPTILRGRWSGEGNWSATGKTTINSNTHTTQTQMPVKHLTIPPFSYPGQSSVIHLDVLLNVRLSHLCFVGLHIWINVRTMFMTARHPHPQAMFVLTATKNLPTAPPCVRYQSHSLVLNTNFECPIAFARYFGPSRQGFQA